MNRATSLRCALVLCLTALTPGCCTIIRGLEQEVTITSSPPGAAFQFGDLSGTTPATLKLSRSRHSRRFSCGAPDHLTAEIEITPDKLTVGDAPAMLIPAIVGGLLIFPLIFDLTTAWDRDYPRVIHAQLVPAGRGGLSTVSVTRAHAREEPPPPTTVEQSEEARTEEERMKIPIWRRPPRYADK